MWGDLESEKDVEKWKNRAIKRARQQSDREVSENDLGIETGNPLIGSFGRQDGNFLIFWLIGMLMIIPLGLEPQLAVLF